MEKKMSKLNTLLMVCFALVLASTARAQVNNAELNGDYAFSFNGITSFGGGPTPLAAVGRFTADGAGNITAGELDVNGTGPGAVAAATPFTGTYSIGADNRGIPGHHPPVVRSRGPIQSARTTGGG